MRFALKQVAHSFNPTVVVKEISLGRPPPGAINSGARQGSAWGAELISE